MSSSRRHLVACGAPAGLPARTVQVVGEHRYAPHLNAATVSGQDAAAALVGVG
jgi:hypothetical protein